MMRRFHFLKHLSGLVLLALTALWWTSACTQSSNNEKPVQEQTTEPSKEAVKELPTEPAVEPRKEPPPTREPAKEPTQDTSDAAVQEPSPEPAPDKGKDLCIGAKPDEAAWADGGAPTPVPPPLPDSPPKEGDDCTKSPGTCVGKAWPIWKLKDFQPQSCGYKATYGLPTFKGRVTVVVLLSAWCGYCQGQAEKLERIRLELGIAGKAPNVVVVNSIDAKDDQKKLVDRCSFPLFQDTDKMQAWKRHNGGKDDFYIYGKDGKLVHYFSSSDPNLNTDLSTKDGYKFVKDTLLKLLK